MFKLLLAPMCFMLTSCGTTPKDLIERRFLPDHPTDKKIDPEFQSHVDRFSKYLGRKVEIRIQFEELDDETVGLCAIYSDGYREIEIDREYWDDAEESVRDELIFHELGHCILDLDHDETLINKGNYYQIPNSIMYPFTFGYTSYYKEFIEEYHQELFTHGK